MSDPVLHHLLFYDYVADVLERRGPFRADHLAQAQRHKDTGTLVSGGALGSPPTGAMFVFLVEDVAQIDAFVAADPYVINGLVTGHRIVPWNVVV